MKNNEQNYNGDAVAVDVLDHGFVALRNVSGPTRRPGKIGPDYGAIELRQFDADDRDPAQAARMSFGKMDSERTLEEDLRLSRYLMKNWHNSPFEMVEVWLEMKMPIFVARQFVRHRTVSINEVSGRYVKLPAEWYVPEVVGGKPANAKQGQTDSLSNAAQGWFKDELSYQCANSYERYEIALEKGVAPEHARMFLHLNHYTHWLWKQDLHNLFHFLRLRDHSHAQLEAQAYAKAVDKLVRAVLPETFKLYDEFRRLEA